MYSRSVDWVAPTIGAMGAIGGYLLGHLLSQRSAEKQWDRDLELREAEWRREDARRWDKERLEAYSSVVAETLNLIDSVMVFSSEWDKPLGEKDEDLVDWILDRQAAHIEARARAVIVASSAMRPSITKLSDAVSDCLSSLFAAHDNGESRDEYLERFKLDVGDALADFAKAAKSEIGVELSHQIRPGDLRT